MIIFSWTIYYNSLCQYMGVKVRIALQMSASSKLEEIKVCKKKRETARYNNRSNLYVGGKYPK